VVQGISALFRRGERSRNAALQSGFEQSGGNGAVVSTGDGTIRGAGEILARAGQIIAGGCADVRRGSVLQLRKYGVARTPGRKDARDVRRDREPAGGESVDDNCLVHRRLPGGLWAAGPLDCAAAEAVARDARTGGRTRESNLICAPRRRPKPRLP